MDVYGVDMKRLRLMYLQVVAAMMTLPFLTFVLWFMFRTPNPADTGSDPMSLLEVGLFAALSVIELPLAIWIRGMTLRGTGDFTGKTWRYGPTKSYTGADAAVMRITTAGVVSMSLLTVPVLLGFVAGFMSESWTYFLPFAAYAVLGWIIMFPRPSQVRDWYERQSPGSALPEMNVGGPA